MADPTAASVASPVSVPDKGLVVYILGWAIASAVICEAISWLLVYRREDYQRLHVHFTNASKRLERKREAPVPPPKAVKGGDKKDKKLMMLEREFGHAKRDLLAFKVSSHRPRQRLPCRSPRLRSLPRCRSRAATC